MADLTPVTHFEKVIAKAGGDSAYSAVIPITHTEQIIAKYGGGGGGGSSDYTHLINKPKINNVTLDGNKSWADLGLSNPMHIAGRVDAVSDLPSTATEGDVYLVGLVSDTEKAEYVYVSGGWEYLGTSAIEVDSALSTTSENPVQNKVITSALNDKLKGTNVSNAEITVASDYIELSNGKRLYVCASEPTGNIPDGSIWIPASTT